jgi:hypothetical protein
MSAVAGNALFISHRFMLDFIARHISFDLRMTIQADLTRLVLDKVFLIGAMRSVTGATFAPGERRMSEFFSLFRDQVLMARQAECPIVCCNLEQSGYVTTMGCMTGRAFSAGKRPVLAEKSLCSLGFPMTGETKSRLFFGQ